MVFGSSKVIKGRLLGGEGGGEGGGDDWCLIYCSTVLTRTIRQVGHPPKEAS